MPTFKYNPFLKLGLDRVSGSGSTPLIPDTNIVDNPTLLPDPVVHDSQYWIADNASGVFLLGTRKDAGIYKAVSGAWVYRGADVPYYFDDLISVSMVTADYNLPDAVSYPGRILRLANRSGSAWTISAIGGDTVESAASQVIQDGETFDLTPIGTNWIL